MTFTCNQWHCFDIFRLATCILHLLSQKSLKSVSTFFSYLDLGLKSALLRLLFDLCDLYIWWMISFVTFRLASCILHLLSQKSLKSISDFLRYLDLSLNSAILEPLFDLCNLDLWSMISFIKFRLTTCILHLFSQKSLKSVSTLFRYLD